jgi:hypothetical protein
MHGAALHRGNLLGDRMRRIPITFLIPPKGSQRLGKFGRRSFIIDTLEKFVKVHNYSFLY